MKQPIIINNFDQGIADSPHKGFGLMRCVDIQSFSGAAKTCKAATSLFHTTASAVAFTAVATTDICTATGTFAASSNTTGTAITVGSSNGGLTAGTIYFIRRISDTSKTFYLYDTAQHADSGGATGLINITSDITSNTISTVTPGTINHIQYEPKRGQRFFLDSNGKVWYLDPTTNAARCRLLIGNTQTNAGGNGLCSFINSDNSYAYLFVFRDKYIDVCRLGADLGAITATDWSPGATGWQTMNSAEAGGVGNRHHAILAQDNIIYFTDDRYVGSIKENSGQVFAPGTPATYTYTNNALDLPNGEIAQHLEELITKLLIAGNNSNKIYPWDRTSASFNTPLYVPEYSIKRLKNIGNIVYILAGTQGNVYSTQGSYVQLAKRIPSYVGNNDKTTDASAIVWGGIDAMNGTLIFGMSSRVTGNDGIYYLEPDGRLTIGQITSAGSQNVTAIHSQNNFYYFGYANGADVVTTSRWSSYEGIIDSPFYVVATKTEKSSFHNLEVVIAQPASAGNIRIGYRTNLNASFTTLATFAMDGASVSFESDIGIIDIENIQIRIEMDGSSVGGNAPELLEVRILP